MKRILLLSIILLTSFLTIDDAFAQETDQVPAPPPVPQPEPEPEPIPRKEPKPIEQPFPGLTDEEKLEKLTEENQKLKAENAELKTEIENLKIQKNFLQGQVDEIAKKLEDLNAVALEQIQVIMSLVSQLKETVFETIFLPFVSV